VMGRAAAGVWVLLVAGLSCAPGLAGIQRRVRDGGQHWSFVAPRQPRVPAVRDRAWVRNPIDAFILAALEKRGLRPSPPADRRSLLRRVTLDLTGLLPTPVEIAAFLADRSPDAYEKVVRRLLASPHYGERWGQHWLDVVRFAETNGFELDADRPQAWRYRDWVVRALNEDEPYDRFILEQLAGDELGEKGKQEFDLCVATGFVRAGPQHVVGGNQDEAVNRQEWLTEAVTGVGNAILGLTVQCARCHDHKYDPIPQTDYYRLQAFFAAADNHEFKPSGPVEEQAYEAASKAHKERLRPILEQIAAIEKPCRERLRQEKLAKLEPQYAQALALEPPTRSPEQRRLVEHAQVMLKVEWDELVPALSPAERERRATLRHQLHTLELEAPPPLPIAPGVADVIAPVPTVRVLVRGDPHTPGEEVQPGFVRALLPKDASSAAQIPTLPPGAKSSGRRTALARWLTQPDHPLTSRVIVNRLWQHHFGRGIVSTPNDFGRNGSPPTHPELLDWLAAALMDGGAMEYWSNGVLDRSGSSGSHCSSTPSLHHSHPASVPPSDSPSPAPWSLKKMHYLMVTSSAYRQSSSEVARMARLDPDNRLLWRMNRQRLDAEALRDSILEAAGTLNLQMGGPSVRVPLEPEVYATIFTEGEPDNLWPVTPDTRQHTRRSLYLLHKRNVRLPMLAVFDQPDMMTSCAARGETVHALQALTLMNSEFMTQQSQAMARRMLAEGAGIERLFILTLGRPPRGQEMKATEKFLQEQTALIRARMTRGEPVARLTGLPADADPTAAAAWADLCLAVFNLNEFAYVN
jgi:hypothetical protein